MFDLFKPKAITAQKKRRFRDGIYWFYTTRQNKVQAHMVKQELKAQGFRAKVSKKHTKLFGEEYDIWARKP